MSTVPPPPVRFRHACSAAGIDPAAPSRRIVSHSNDVWSIDDPRLGAVVLRVSWRGDVARLGREISVAGAMPTTVWYPDVVGHGVVAVDGAELGYSVTRRMAGRQLDECWPGLSGIQRRSAVSQLAGMLRDLHSWQPDPAMTELVLERSYRPAERITGLLGADLNPLPVARALELAEHATTLPHIDAGLIRAVIDRLGEFAPAAEPVDEPEAHGLIHGDLQLCNLWWSDPGTVTVLDLEWVRFAPPLLDLQRFCEQADTDALTGAHTHQDVVRWLESDYPEPFHAPDAAAQLRLFSLTYAIRDVIVNPPDRDPGDLPAEHSLHRLRRLVDGTWPVPGALPDSLVS